MSELLQQIATNTTPAKTTMISVRSTKPEFGINFPNPIPVGEIALARLSVYHTWPNIRSTSFGQLQSNNSFVFSYKTKTDTENAGVSEPDWDTITLPTGSYQIEEINDEIQRQIKKITGKESKIAILAHIPTLSATVEISTPGYAVDIYNSSIRTVLGWPEEKPLAKPRPPEPKKSDYTSDGLKSVNYEEIIKDHRLYFPIYTTNMKFDYLGFGSYADGKSHWRYYRVTDKGILLLLINIMRRKPLLEY